MRRKAIATRQVHREDTLYFEDTELVQLLLQLVRHGHDTGSVQNWQCVADSVLLKAAEDWLEALEKYLRQSEEQDKHGNDGSIFQKNDNEDIGLFWEWKETLDGISNGKWHNGFLGGSGEDAAYINAPMAVFADFHWIIADGKMFLTWLGFAREVRIIHGSIILQAQGPLYCLSEQDVRTARPLGDVWYVGQVESDYPF